MTNTSIQPNYFFDEMTFNEANAIIDSISDKDKVSWEQTRWLGYITALTQGAKINKPTDLIKFQWDKEETNEDTRTKEEIKCSLLNLKNSFK